LLVFLVLLAGAKIQGSGCWVQAGEAIAKRRPAGRRGAGREMDNRERERRSPASPGLRPESTTDLRTLSDRDGAGSAGRPFRGQSPAPGSAGRGAAGAALKPLVEKVVIATPPPLEDPGHGLTGADTFLSPWC
jgi:hypothetical protein